MLHDTLATNFLLAIGGEPDFLSPGILPLYPEPMLHHIPELVLNLERCSAALIRDAFVVIERPETPGAATEQDFYETQGQFYFATEKAFIRLAENTDLFRNHQPERQLSTPSYYGTVQYHVADSGGLVIVEDLDSAVAAIEIVAHQGEGLRDERWADPDHQKLTHYYKFLRIEDGTSPVGAVRPALRNPRTVDFPTALRPVSDLFNALYRYVYITMQELFSPVTEKDELVDRLYTLMPGVLSPIARYLMEQQLEDGQVAGPTFERYDLGGDPASGIPALAVFAATTHPGLAEVADKLANG